MRLFIIRTAASVGAGLLLILVAGYFGAGDLLAGIFGGAATVMVTNSLDEM